MNRLVRRLSKYVNTYLDTRIIYLIDLFLSMLASVASIVVLRVVLDALPQHYILRTVPGAGFGLQWTVVGLVCSAVSFALLRSYRVIIRHSSLKDLLRLGLAALLKSLLMLLLAVLVERLTVTIWCVLALDFFLTLFFLELGRLFMILAYSAIINRLNKKKPRQHILVYGTSDKSVALVTRLGNSPHYQVLGFLVSDGQEHDYRLMDLPVFDVAAARQEFSRPEAVAGILFAAEQEARAEKEGVVAFAVAHGIKVFVAPTIDELAGGNLSFANIRNIKIEDLLCRPEIKISMQEIQQNFCGKVVMVTGAAGSIGSELCRQLAGFGIKQLILFDNAETPMHNLRLELEDTFPNLDFVPVIGDVRQSPRLDYVFRKWHPQVVFHAAAYKHVPLMEENPCEAVLVNVQGTRNVAEKCLEYQVEKMVMISTDKAVNPTNIMGCTKRLAEMYVQSLGLALTNGTLTGPTRFVTTRFGNVLGSNGSVIPRFRDQILHGGPVTVTDPRINRFFMTIPEACRLVMEAATLSMGNQIFVFDMGEPVLIDTLARRMIELSGLKPDEDIKVEYTGLRPGEKLYEEVLSNAENTLPTSHDRIRIAKVRDCDYQEALRVTDQLYDYSMRVDIPPMVKLMKQAVPEYVSNNSEFEIYDR